MEEILGGWNNLLCASLLTAPVDVIRDGGGRVENGKVAFAVNFLLVVLLYGGGDFEDGDKVVSDLKVKDR